MRLAGSRSDSVKSLAILAGLKSCARYATRQVRRSAAATNLLEARLLLRPDLPDGLPFERMAERNNQTGGAH